MSAPEHIGSGHEDEPYVGLLRGISPEVHAHELTMAKSRSFDEGWRKACAYLESDLRENKRAFGLRIEDRVWREVRRRRRAALAQGAYYGAIAVVMIAALLYLRGLS